MLTYKKNFLLRIKSIIIFFLLFGLIGESYSAILYTNINTRKISIGDRIHLGITVIVPKGTTVKPPEPEGSFGKLSLKEWNFRKREKESIDTLLYDYIITTYSPEPCTIPSLNFIVESEEKAETLSTESIPIDIITLVSNDSADIMDIKPPLRAGRAPKWWLWIIIIILSIGALIFIWVYLKKKFTRVPPPPPPVPPYEEAIEALKNLGLKKYLQRGLYREYVFELSEIFKRYIGRVFNCNALEFTTEEILKWLNSSELPTKLKKIIEYFFETTDPIKFARYVPEISVVENLEKEVRNFLEETKPKEESLSEEKKDESLEQKEKEKESKVRTEENSTR